MNLTSLSKGQEKAGNFAPSLKLSTVIVLKQLHFQMGVPSPSVLLVGAVGLTFHRPGVGHIQQYSTSGSARKQDLRQVV